MPNFCSLVSVRKGVAWVGLTPEHVLRGLDKSSPSGASWIRAQAEPGDVRDQNGTESVKPCTTTWCFVVCVTRRERDEGRLDKWNCLSGWWEETTAR